MRILRAAEGRRAPWKNGGGETREIAAHPPGAGLDGFGWRVSVAWIAADGPFSPFPGVDRALAVLSGGLELSLAGAAPVRRAAGDAPHAFPGEAPCAARPLGGPATVLNAMARRGRFTCALRRLDLAEPTTLDGGATVVVCTGGQIAAAGAVLEVGDAAMADRPLALAPRGGPARLLVATFRPAP